MSERRYFDNSGAVDYDDEGYLDALDATEPADDAWTDGPV